jgi:hypothetical protein
VLLQRDHIQWHGLSVEFHENQPTCSKPIEGIQRDWRYKLLPKVVVSHSISTLTGETRCKSRNNGQLVAACLYQGVPPDSLLRHTLQLDEGLHM